MRSAAGVSYRYQDVMVADVQPRDGTTLGGEVIRVLGIGLPAQSGRLLCHFGSQHVEATSVSETEARCTSPSQPTPATVPVRFTLSGVRIPDSGPTFSYRPALTISSVQPPGGPVDGGSRVVVSISSAWPCAATACRASAKHC